MAPPFEFLARAFVPTISRMGVKWDLSLLRHGFYPAGGGGVVARIEPSRWRGLQLTKRSSNGRLSATILLSQLPDDVAEREKQWLRRHLGIPSELIVVEKVSANSPGNVVLISVESNTHTEVFSALGERGKRAEHVAEEAFDAWKAFDRSASPVGEHLADQLLLPMTLAANQGQPSRFRTHVFSDHAQTHVELLKIFYPTVAIRQHPIDETDEFMISVEPEMAT
jgi:RNA 3'-terminal phosphate cyclase (ATP)